MKRRIGLSLMAVAMISGAANAAVISGWNFNQYLGPDGTLPVSNLVGNNPGHLVGAQEWGGAFEGGVMINLPSQFEWSRFYASTNGFSVNAGTYIFSYKTNGGALLDWRDILGTGLAAGGTDPLRLEYYQDGGKPMITIFGGVSSPAYDATALFDGQWHTVALTYADNDKVKVYIDGTPAFQSNENYSAASFSMLNTFAIGNRGNDGTFWGHGLGGYYDRPLVLDEAVSAENLPTYLDPGYVFDTATLYFAPDAGTYLQALNVTLTCYTPSAAIYYTTDGSDPSAAHGTQITSGTSILIDHNLTLKAVAVVNERVGNIFSGNYTIVPDDQKQNVAFTVPAIGTITLDGDLSDWPAATPWSAPYIWWNGDALPSTTQAKFAWNDAGDTLYVAIRTNQSGGGHAVVGISTDINAVAESSVGNATQLAFDIVNGSVAVMNEITEYNKGKYNQLTTGVAAGVQLGSDGYYTYEIAIPVWTNWNTTDTRVSLSGGSILYVYSMMQDAFGTPDGMDMTFNGNPHFANAGGIHYASALTLQAPSALPGDANGDHKVDVSDLGILAANYGTTGGATWATGDFNGDGKVDVSDLGILAANYGTGTGSALDFDADAKALGLTGVEAKADAPTTSSLGCGSAGLPLIAGLLLMGMLFVRLDE